MPVRPPSSSQRASVSAATIKAVKAKARTAGVLTSIARLAAGIRFTGYPRAEPSIELPTALAVVGDVETLPLVVLANTHRPYERDGQRADRRGDRRIRC